MITHSSVFNKVKYVKYSSFKNPQESATSHFYRLTHKCLLQNNLQILWLYWLNEHHHPRVRHEHWKRGVL